MFIRIREEQGYMRRFVVCLLLLVIFFIFPLQVFIIGNEIGIGIQGAVYRYQVTGYGNSLIPITQEIMYIAEGIYSGKTALSIILWASGTVLLTITTWYGLVSTDGSNTDFNRKVSIGLAGSCVCYLISCIAQYGLLFQGPAGVSFPAGIGIILVWLGFLRFFQPEMF